MNILIVVDMQNDFITGSLANPYAERIVPEIAKEIMSGKYDYVIATRDTHFDEGYGPSIEYGSSIEGKHLPIKHCIWGTQGWMVPKEIEDAMAKCKSVFHDKHNFCAIRLPSICSEVIDNGSEDEIDCEHDSITLVGTCTDICVISNALFLKTLPYEINVIERLCAGTTKENHDAAIKVMRQCHVNII